jgi:DNA-binding transcriptional LysR family regulator
MICHRQHQKYFVMSSLNLNHLRSFAQVIAHGSFSAAAHWLCLTQPAISLHIRLLEERLGLRLIERVGKRIRPTSAGMTLLKHVARIDDAVQDALRDLSSHVEGVVGQVSIGTGATACIHLLPPVLKRLRETYPALDVRVSTGNTADILKAVEENRLDVALVTLPASGRNLHIEPLLEDEFVAILPADIAASAEPVGAETLKGLGQVMFESGSSTRWLIDDWFAKAGARSKPVMELGSIEAIKEMVAAGMGYSIVPGISVAAAHHRRNLQVRSLDPPLSRTISIVLRQDKPVSRGLRQVLQGLQELNDGGSFQSEDGPTTGGLIRTRSGQRSDDMPT